MNAKSKFSFPGYGNATKLRYRFFPPTFSCGPQQIFTLPAGMRGLLVSMDLTVSRLAGTMAIRILLKDLAFRVYQERNSHGD